MAGLEFLRRRASDRKVRLFAVACGRRVWASLEHEEFRDAVRKAESFARGDPVAPAEPRPPSRSPATGG
jgi:hypothetical protein